MTRTGQIRRLRGWLWSARRPGAIYLLVTVLAGATTPALAWATKLLLDSLDHPRRELAVAALLLIIISLSAAIMPVLAGLASARLRHVLTEVAVKDTLVETERHSTLAELESPTWQYQIRAADIAARDAPMRLVQGVCGGIQAGITVTLFSVALWSIQPWMAAAVVVGGAPLWFVERHLATYAVGTTHATIPFERTHMLFAGLLWDPRVAPETKLFGSGPALLERSIAALRTSNRIQWRREKYQTFWKLASAAFMTLFVGIGLLLLVTQEPGPTPGEVTLFLAAVLATQQSVLALVEQLSGTREGLLALAQSSALMAPRSVGQTCLPKRPRRGLDVDSVVFRYNQGVDPVLDQVSLHIPPGNRIAVVGPNGAGKTSLLKVAAGLYPVESGTITYDGDPIADADVIRRITAVFQEPARYDLTVRENITISDQQGRERDPTMPARVVGLHDRITALPRGYETVLSRTVELGETQEVKTYFSGGEWQRVAMARALFRTQAQVLLLDEPAAHLDSVAANATVDLVKQWTDLDPIRSVLMVTHRLSHVVEFDQIYVMDQGRVVEKGTHCELLELGGSYARLWDAADSDIS